MAEVGDRVQALSPRVGQAVREGVVTGVSGGLLRIKWSTGEESTVVPAAGSLRVTGKGSPRPPGAPKKATAKAAKAVNSKAAATEKAAVKDRSRSAASATKASASGTASVAPTSAKTVKKARGRRG